jgi:hypothetical protein
MLQSKFFLECKVLQINRAAEARQRYQEYLDRFPWGEHAQEALAALERLGGQ